MTPEELEKQRQQENNIRKSYRKNLVLQSSLAIGAGVAVTQLSSLDKINQSILDKTESVKGKILNQIIPLSEKLGIEGIETGNPKLPDLCPSPIILDQVYNIRQSFGNDLTNLLTYISAINKSFDILTFLINGQITTINALNLIKSSTSISSKLIPSPPGVPGIVTSLLSDLENLKNIITFTIEGEPKIPKIKRALDNGTKYVGIASQSLLKIIALLKIIDLILDKCGKKVEPFNNELLNSAEQVLLSPIDSSYNGFIFDIIEEPFNERLNQKVAIAKNSQGIILLKSEASFTDNPQVLINELKLIIDRDNLKAN
jgi:hypothetical protein